MLSIVEPFVSYSMNNNPDSRHMARAACQDSPHKPHPTVIEDARMNISFCEDCVEIERMFCRYKVPETETIGFWYLD